MKHWTALTLVGLMLVTCGSRREGASQPEIIQIDTGTLSSFDGAIRMPVNLQLPWHAHGTQMARALAHEASRQDLWQVRVKQIQWRSEQDLVFRIWDAIGLKPKIISLSLAGDRFDEEEHRALREAGRRNILVLAASGNTGRTRPQYPAAYSLPCLVAVSTMEQGKRVKSANAGEMYLEREEDEWGTSFSTARAAAIAYRVWQEHPRWSCSQVKSYLMRHFRLPGRS